MSSAKKLTDVPDRSRTARKDGTAMPQLSQFPTSLVGSYPQPEWLIDRAFG